MLKLENRALQNELETVARTTEHVQQSHRKTMEAVLRGEVPVSNRKHKFIICISNFLSISLITGWVGLLFIFCIRKIIFQSREPGGGWERHPLEKMLSTDGRKVSNITEGFFFIETLYSFSKKNRKLSGDIFTFNFKHELPRKCQIARLLPYHYGMLEEK